MSAGAVAADVLLGLAAVTVVGSSVGELVMRDVYQKIHFVTPAGLVAPVFVAAAVLAEDGFSENTAETWLALALLIVAGPILTHATIRAARIRQTGDWRPIGTARIGPSGDGS
jgi:multisubunit Na+/H+ antiporter MnhG subunit